MPQVGIARYGFVLLLAEMRYKPEPLSLNKGPEIFGGAENHLMSRTVKLLRQQQKWIHITAAAYGDNKNFHMSVLFSPNRVAISAHSILYKK